MSTEIELRLVDRSMPSGEISFEDLAGIATTLQELTLRIARTCVPSLPTGRPSTLVNDLSHLRLRGLTSGSTVLTAVRGLSSTLEIEREADDLLDGRLADVVRGLAQGRRPEWADDAISGSVAAFGKALRRAAPHSEFSVGDGESIRIDSSAMTLEIWESTPATPAKESVVSGLLEAVDLRRNRFRIVDALLHRVRLEDVQDAETVATLIGTRVQARGVGVLDEKAVLRSLREPVLTAAPLPASWTVRVASDLNAELSKPGPVLDAGPELDDDEFDALIAYLRN